MASQTATERDERELIRRIRSGEKEFFHELIRPYERSVYGLIHSVLPNAADAEEVAQEAVFKAFLHLDQLADDERFKAWLLRIAVNEARMRRLNRWALSAPNFSCPLASETFSPAGNRAK